MQVRAHAHPNHIGVDAEFTINNWGNAWGGTWDEGWWWDNRTSGTGRLREIRLPGSQTPRVGGNVNERDVLIYVTTDRDINHVRVVGAFVSHSDVLDSWYSGTNTREWRLRFRINTNTPTGWRTFSVEALDGGIIRGEGSTPGVWVTN